MRRSQICKIHGDFMSLLSHLFSIPSCPSSPLSDCDPLLKFSDGVDHFLGSRSQIDILTQMLPDSTLQGVSPLISPRLAHPSRFFPQPLSTAPKTRHLYSYILSHDHTVPSSQTPSLQVQHKHITSSVSLDQYPSQSSRPATFPFSALSQTVALLSPHHLRSYSSAPVSSAPPPPVS